MNTNNAQPKPPSRKRFWPMWIGVASVLILILLLIFQPIQHEPNEADQPRWGRQHQIQNQQE